MINEQQSKSFSILTGKNLKVVLLAIGFFIVGIVIAFLFENYYRQFVRYLFKFFNGDTIQFYGKKFHLLASDEFVIAFGLFCSVMFLLLNASFYGKRIIRFLLTVSLFFVSLFFTTFTDSKRLIIECTACDNGIRKLQYDGIAYDSYFITSLVTALLYLLWVYFSERKRFLNLKNTN